MSRTYQPHEFAKRAGVTIRALHHYDRLGLLKPSRRTAAYEDEINWPETFKKPYSDAVNKFLCDAAKGLMKA